MKKEFVFAFMLILGIGFIFAGNCPPVGPPKIYNGDVYVNGSLLGGAYTIRAMIGEDMVGEVEFSDGTYTNLQISPCPGVSGDIIFSVNGIEANEKGYYYGTQEEWGERVVLDLTLNEKPTEEGLCGNGELDPGEECDGALLASCGDGYEGTISCNRSTCLIDYSNCTMLYCGDGECNNGETCSTCSDDCGSCSSNDNNNGGGGGGSSDTTNTIQTGNNGSNESSNDTIDLTRNETKVTGTKNKVGITGAVIGTLGTGGTFFVAIFVLLIIIGCIAIVANKRKK